MADEKNLAPHSGPGAPNWLFGLDRLTTPTLDLLGLKIRDKLRSYLNEKARERALLRRFEKEFLYRHIDLLSYGTDQYAAMLETLANVIIERHFKTVVPMIHFAVTKFEIPPERAFDSIIKGFGHVPVTLTDGEFVLYSVAAGVLDVALVIQTAQLVFQFTHIPSSVHFNNPEISDEEIEAIMQDPATMQAVSDAMDPNVGGIAKRFAKALADAYGLPFDGEAFDKAYDSGSPPRT